MPRIIHLDLKIEQNAIAHRTDKFHMTNCSRQLVIRRGQQFSISFRTDAELNLNSCSVTFVLATGKVPKPGDGTLISMTLVNESKKTVQDLWQAWMEELEMLSPMTYNVKIITAADTPVAKWDMDIFISSEQESSRFTVPGIYILFNPWNKDDTVYCFNEDLEEYILNDVGKIWAITQPRFWYFGQFTEGILEASMAVLDKSPRLSRSQRSNAITVSREAAAMMNPEDNPNGIMKGRWDGKYDDGVSPLYWTESTKILRQWMETNTFVRYAQCWVFAGVLTTVLRALGIPCRPITNYISCVDMDSNLYLDEYFDEHGRHITWLSTDFAWNFHSWCEVFMSRPDLPAGYGGWQIIDGTPQETNDGKFYRGPTSRNAIFKGEVGFRYDGPFVFAEVNADKAIWLYRTPPSPTEIIDIKTEFVGNLICTKIPGTLKEGDEDMNNITNKYKPPEGTLGERAQFARALETLSYREQRIRKHEEWRKRIRKDIDFEITMGDIPLIGQDFFLQLKLKNNTTNKLKVDCEVQVHSLLHVGKVGKLIKRTVFNYILGPEEVKLNEISVSHDEYLHALVDYGSMKASVSIIVDENKENILQTDYIFQLQRPTLNVEVKDLAGDAKEVVVTFKNPLPIELTGGDITIEGPGLEKNYESPTGSIPPEYFVKKTFEVKTSRTDIITVLANFNSKELQGLNGFKVIGAI